MNQCRVQIVILCEDRQQEVFARYFLKKRGFNGLFRAKICPPSSQSGEQYVCTQYPVEVKAYRQNRNRLSIGLVVFIDADTSTPQERLDYNIVVNNGLVISEVLPMKKQDTFSVIKSCRIQAGLGAGLILIQSSTNGGSRFTVKAAFESNRPIGV